MTFEVGGETIEASAGDYVFGPRDIPHRYTVGPEGCRMLFILTPGGFEELVRATSEPAGERTLPPAPTEEPDFEAIAAVPPSTGPRSSMAEPRTAARRRPRASSGASAPATGRT